MTTFKFWMLPCFSFPSISIQIALKHHSVGVEFEKETEVKDINKKVTVVTL